MWTMAVASVAMAGVKYAAQANAERNAADTARIGAEMERMQFEHEQKQAALDAKKDEAARQNERSQHRNRDTAMGNVKDTRLLGASRAFKFGVGSAAKGVEIAAYNQRKKGAMSRALLGFGTDMARLGAQGGFSSFGTGKKA